MRGPLSSGPSLLLRAILGFSLTRVVLSDFYELVFAFSAFLGAHMLIIPAKNDAKRDGRSGEHTQRLVSSGFTSSEDTVTIFFDITH